MKDPEREKRNEREGMEGGKKIVTLQHRFTTHTHTYFEFDYNHCPHVPSEGQWVLVELHTQSTHSLVTELI